MKNKFFLLAITFCLPIHSQGVSKSFIPMAEIPAGSFYMGSDGLGEDFDEAPIHQVIISRPFRMGITEITNAQYESFRPEHRALRGKNGVSLEDDEAVVNVSYSDAVAFCEWLSRKEGKNYRLPTEAEWEYACRAGTYTLFSTGDGLPAVYHRNQKVVRDFDPVSLKVAQTPPNTFGLYDMHGNVEEWTNSDYLPYPYKDKLQGTGTEKVVRGGSWIDRPKFATANTRKAFYPWQKVFNVGFRVIIEE